MIGEFFDSWELFQTTYLSGWLIAGLLALVGVWVVARNQIFLGVAVAQASTLGIAAALWLGGLGVGWLGSDAGAAALAVGASVATALLTARTPVPGRESAEAVTGWVYLLAGSLPVLLLARSPHGLEEVHHLIFSTLLGATTTDLAVFVLLSVATAGLVARYHTRLLLFALDPEMAAATGMHRRIWNALVAIWLGLAIGLSIRVSGTLYTFGCLVLPAFVVRSFSREIRPLLWWSPGIAIASAVAAFVLAHHYDVPPAHATVTILCAALGVGWVWRAATR